MDKKPTLQESARARAFENVGRISQSIASPIRLRIIQSLANSPRTVESLAEKTGESIANTSQHLQKMLKSGVLTCERRGVSRVYSLANNEVFQTWLALQKLAYTINPQLQYDEELLAPTSITSDLSAEEVMSMVHAKKAILIDAREFEDSAATPVDGALHIQKDELKEAISKIPKKKTVFVFCRGRYCDLANPMVMALREKGFNAYRLKAMAPELQHAEGA